MDYKWITNGLQMDYKWFTNGLQKKSEKKESVYFPRKSTADLFFFRVICARRDLKQSAAKVNDSVLEEN